MNTARMVRILENELKCTASEAYDVLTDAQAFGILPKEQETTLEEFIKEIRRWPGNLRGLLRELKEW